MEFSIRQYSLMVSSGIELDSKTEPWETSYKQSVFDLIASIIAVTSINYCSHRHAFGRVHESIKKYCCTCTQFLKHSSILLKGSHQVLHHQNILHNQNSLILCNVVDFA